MAKVVSILLNPFTHDSRVLKECLSLQKAGYDISVAAMHEKDLPFYEEVEGIPVHRIQIKSRSWSRNRLVQLFKFLEFSWRMARNHARKADILHVNDVGPLPLAVFCKWFFNWKLKIIYDAHELEFDKAEKGSNYYPQWALAFAERLFIKRAHRVMTVSPLIANAYQERYGIPKPAVVMNCPPYAPPSGEKLLRKAFGISDSQKLYLYQGGLIPKRGVELLLDIFQELPSDYQLVFLGFGPLTDQVKKVAAAHENIHFHEAVSPTVLHDYTSDADVGFCIYQGKTGNHQLTIGNKIFQYIMAGVPVLASDLQGLKYVLQDPGLGMILPDFRNKAAVKKAILEMAKIDKTDRKESFEKAAKVYTWEAQETVLLKVYQEISQR
ncbi:MAG: glycosyltransferase family 4 protein [Bacteroidetes bacterium]|nr:glycosyltransferase family 4 protein [Bacteroidota bacterium]